MSKPLKKAGRAVEKAAFAPIKKLAVEPIQQVGAKAMEQLVPDINIEPDTAATDLMREQEQRAANMRSDLTLENIADIRPGGTASSLGGSSTRRRRRSGQTVSTSLGINA